MLYTGLFFIHYQVPHWIKNSAFIIHGIKLFFLVTALGGGYRIYKRGGHKIMNACWLYDYTTHLYNRQNHKMGGGQNYYFSKNIFFLTTCIFIFLLGYAHIGPKGGEEGHVPEMPHPRSTYGPVQLWY